MRILIVHNFYQRKNVGGEDLVFINEVASLKRNLGESNVLTYSVYNDDIKFIKLLFSIWFSIKTFFQIMKILRKEKIELLHVHNFFPLITPSVFVAAKILNIKTVSTLHNYRLSCIAGTFYRDGFGICELCKNKVLPLYGVKFKCYRKSYLQSIFAQLAFSFYKLTFQIKNIDYFFVLTPFQKSKFLELNIPASKLILKPNSYNSGHVSAEKSGYLFVGRFEDGKGLHLILNAWQSLPGHFKLTVVGAGPGYEDTVNTNILPNVVFRNYLSREETLKEISKAKYLIHSSLYYETFGLTILEALSMGTPVIGFDIGTRKDFIQNGFNGFLIQQDDLLDTVLKTIDFKDYDLLSRNALQSSRQFEEEVVIKRQISFYESIISGSEIR